MEKCENKNLLVEIGCEELPVSHQKYVRESRANVPDLEDINHGAAKIYTTPRRIVWYIEDVAEKQQGRLEKVFGPPKNIAFDKEGKLTAAALGFANSKGVRPENLKTEKKGNGEYVCAVTTIKGKDTLSYLRETLPNFLHNIWFEKTMRWDGKGSRFSRPVRWILALYGDEVIKFSAFGINSSNFTFGNRLVSKKRIIIKEADIEGYKKVLKKEYVIVDQEERKGAMVEQVKNLYKYPKSGAGSGDIEEQESVKYLLDEVTGLVEYPNAIMGEFPKEYLGLPKELVKTCMMGHERFFPVVNNRGELEAKFISVLNNPCKSRPAEDTIRLGNESVLFARLADAKYFYEQDIKENVDGMLERLKTIIFQGGMGSLYDKAQRMKKLSLFIAEGLNQDEKTKEKVQRAAEFSKIDVGSCVINEFPSLQGIMGRIYAEKSGEDPEIVKAIEEHYYPCQGGSDPGFVGAVVGIADRIDNICAFFAQGYKATGSEDPYGARRDAQNLLEVLEFNNDPRIRDLSVEELIERELELIKEKTVNKNAKKEILDFISQRIKTFFKIGNIEYDEADAVMEIALSKNLHTAVERAKVIQRFRKRPDFGKFIIAFKRVVNILEKAGIEKSIKYPTCAKASAGRQVSSIKEELLKEEQEKNLYEIYLRIKDEVENKVKNNNFGEAMDILLTNLGKPINDFFDHVMVMTEDENLRRNRLSLLCSIANLFFLIADFSKIVLSEAPVGKK